MLLQQNSELEHINNAVHSSKTQFNADVTSVLLEEASLQSTLATQQVELDTANRKITTLQSAIQNAEKECEELKRNIAQMNEKWIPGIVTFQEWMRKHSIVASTPILEDDPLNLPGVAHNVHSYNGLLKVHSEQWSSAYENAQKVHVGPHLACVTSTHTNDKSLDSQVSAMGYIVKTLALIGRGESEKATQVFDLVFGNCNPNESSSLLLIKARDYCSMAGFSYKPI